MQDENEGENSALTSTGHVQPKQDRGLELVGGTWFSLHAQGEYVQVQLYFSAGKLEARLPGS